MAILNKFRSKNVLNKSHNKLHGLTLYAITFQQDNNLKHKAKSTLELFTKKTVNVPEWPSFSFDYLYGKTENGCSAIVVRTSGSLYEGATGFNSWADSLLCIHQ